MILRDLNRGDRVDDASEQGPSNHYRFPALSAEHGVRGLSESRDNQNESTDDSVREEWDRARHKSQRHRSGRIPPRVETLSRSGIRLLTYSRRTEGCHHGEADAYQRDHAIEHGQRSSVQETGEPVSAVMRSKPGTSWRETDPLFDAEIGMHVRWKAFSPNRTERSTNTRHAA